MITENVSTLKIHKMKSQKQYDRELAAGRIDENALYLTPDEDMDLSLYATIEQVDDKIGAAIGDIETALDAIISIQNSFIGGDGE